MSFQVKRKGRPSAKLKMRGVQGIVPKGFAFKGYSRKHKALVFKKVDA